LEPNQAPTFAKIQWHQTEQFQLVSQVASMETTIRIATNTLDTGIPSQTLALLIILDEIF
jgi:hypothetical protein